MFQSIWDSAFMGIYEENKKTNKITYDHEFGDKLLIQQRHDAKNKESTVRISLKFQISSCEDHSQENEKPSHRLGKNIGQNHIY